MQEASSAVSVVVGLTGGIGSGKSAVADLLVAHGAALVDADVVAREVVVPGGPAFAPLVERFGEGILDGDGTIDRQRLADLAFADKESVAALNEITHPAIGIAMIEQVSHAAETSEIVLVAVPLLTELHRETLGLGAVVVVDCPTELAIERLVRFRSFPEQDARARVAAQMSREERVKMADFVIENTGDLPSLSAQVDDLWPRLVALGS